jgi:hypothetical protein
LSSKEKGSIRITSGILRWENLKGIYSSQKLYHFHVTYY